MRKLLVFVLLFMGSSVWAQDTATPSPQETPAISDTALPTTTAVSEGSSWGSAGVPASTPAGNSTSVGAVHDTSTAATVSGSPAATPSTLSKPQALSVAATPVIGNPVGEHLVFQIDGGSVMPISSEASTIYGTGFGFDARIGYAFDDVFSVGLETGFYDLSATAAILSSAPGAYNLPAGASENTSHVPVLFDMQIYFGDAGAPIQPYLVLAAGLSFDAVNLQGTPYKPGGVYSWANFELDPAVGVAFMLDRTTSLFIQSKWAMDFDDYNTTDVNAQSADTPIMFIPLQAGFSFSL
jgi:hypothetical protein